MQDKGKELLEKWRKKRATQYAKDLGGLEIDIYPSEETYRVGDDLRLHVDFVNRGDLSVIFGRPNMRSILDVSMKDQSGNQLPVKPYRDKMIGGGPMNEIKPGERYPELIHINNYVEITKPGIYQVTVQTKGDYYSRMKVNKRTITIKVEEKKEEDK
jgi:hypothetical protein